MPIQRLIPTSRLHVGSCIVSLLLLVLAVASVEAQYFGRNKPRYEDFDFRVMQTPHFEIHYYPPMETAARDAARMAERWYVRLSKLFGHTFVVRRPIILYADQGDFQQTHTIGGEIGEGTGGFTEPIKDRIVLPLTGSYADNDHVIGHELVHAFQYDIAQRSFQQGEQKMAYLPLWFLEGMAEYLSLGRDDPNTAMWMRDIVSRNEIPTIDDVSRDTRYFPYRFGQAIWAYLAGTYGDEIIPRLFRTAIRTTVDDAFRVVLASNEEKLSKGWADALRASFGSDMQGRTSPGTIGRPALDDDDVGMDVAPALSPDGNRMIFLSGRELFSTDVYLVDLRSGDLSKIVSADANPHADALRYINSAGSWSPDGARFVFVVYESGNDRLAILNIAREEIERTITIPGVGALTNPSWSPDGKKIVFSGSVGGISDLFLHDLAGGTTERLTNDRHADLQPVFSPDGGTIAFVSDRGSRTNFGALRYAQPGIALLDSRTLVVTRLDIFADAKTINPMYAPDGRSLYVIADPDGYSDLYRVSLPDATPTRLTRLSTGISGITSISPAMSVARASGSIAFSVFTEGGYAIRMVPADHPQAPSGIASTELVVAGRTLPPPNGKDAQVGAYLADERTGLPPDSMAYPTSDYNATLRLDYFGIPYLGAAVSSDGFALAGATALYFSDFLGYNRMALGLSINGELADIGAELFYEYTRYRWSWGVGGAHYPLTQRGVQVTPVTVDINGTVVSANAIDEITQRTFIDQVAVIGKYPFSSTRRFEVGTGFTRYSFSGDIVSQIVLGNGQVVADTTVDLDFGPGLNLLESYVAYVGDNSFFGFTGPIKGERFRAELGGTVGSLRYMTLTLDYRRYFHLNPFTLALRGYHYGRYGPDETDDRISPLFLGYEWNVRGYMQDSFDPSECSGPGCPEFDRLLGSRMALAGAEIRLPLFGVNGYGLIEFPFLPTDLVAFADAGLAWFPGSHARLALDPEATDRVPVTSVGFAARMNILGYAVLEIFTALPFQRPESGWVWGFSLQPGW